MPSSLPVLLLLLLLASQGEAGAAAEIGLIKKLLSAIFDRYKTDMASLQSVVELATGDLTRWRGQVASRLEDLEVLLGTRTRQQEDPSLTLDQEAALQDRGQGRDFHSLTQRVAKLEDLTRVGTARTCHQLMRAGLRESGHYFIDPDGPGVGAPPVQVYCDLRSGTVRIEHDQPGEQEVTHCREKGCFVRPVNYEIPWRQLVSLILLSGHCEQYVRYDCKQAPLNSGNESNAWWTDRHEGQHFYWSGSARVEEVLGFKGVCYCHGQGTCLEKDKLCNCDASIQAWSYDDGQLTDRSQLPVTKLNFGSLGSEGQGAKFQLGPLYCSGQQEEEETSSCLGLWRGGQTGSGYSLVREKEDDYPKVVFCDGSQLPESPGFQRSYGSPGNLRDFVAFDAFLRAPVEDNYRYIGFTDTLVNIGGAFLTEDGIFKVPVTGTYLFSAHGLPTRDRPFNVQLHRNSRPLATMSNGKGGQSMPGISLVLEVVQGDEIRLYNSGGEIAGDGSSPDFHFHFIGVLLSASDRQ